MRRGLCRVLLGSAGVLGHAGGVLIAVSWLQAPVHSTESTGSRQILQLVVKLKGTQAAGCVDGCGQLLAPPLQGRVEHIHCPRVFLQRQGVTGHITNCVGQAMVALRHSSFNTPAEPTWHCAMHVTLPCRSRHPSPSPAQGSTTAPTGQAAARQANGNATSGTAAACFTSGAATCLGQHAAVSQLGAARDVQSFQRSCRLQRWRQRLSRVVSQAELAQSRQIVASGQRGEAVVGQIQHRQVLQVGNACGQSGEPLARQAQPLEQRQGPKSAEATPWPSGEPLRWSDKWVRRLSWANVSSEHQLCSHCGGQGSGWHVSCRQQQDSDDAVRCELKHVGSPVPAQVPQDGSTPVAEGTPAFGAAPSAPDRRCPAMLRRLAGGWHLPTRLAQ